MAERKMSSGMQTKGADADLKTKQRRLAAPLLDERLYSDASCPDVARAGSFRRIGGNRLACLEVNSENSNRGRKGQT
jgi:hypothetical protein